MNAPDTPDDSGTPQDTPADMPERDPVEQSSNPPEPRQFSQTWNPPDRYGNWFI